MSQFNRTYTFTDGTIAYGSQVESEIANIVRVLNSLDAGTTNWGHVAVLHGTDVPLVADCSSGSQHIANFNNNSVIKTSIDSTGLITATGVAFSPTTGGIVGTTTNDNASAGKVGEYIESVITSSTNAVTSAQYGDLTSISLTAGDWDVMLEGRWNQNSSTWTEVFMGIGTTSGNSSTGTSIANSEDWNFTSASIGSVNIGISPFRVSLSGTTTYYLKYLATYSAGTPQARGRISARRVR